jgi:hypothetical protein
MISIKIHTSYREIVAVCDQSLIGKKLEEDIRQLDIRENFFQGEKYEFDKAVELLKKRAYEDATFNIVGSNAVKAALAAGIIAKEGIATIQDIPFALVLL